MKQEVNDSITAYIARREIPTLAHYLFKAKVGTFPPSYAVIPSFISCFTTFYCIDPYFIFKSTIFKNIVTTENTDDSRLQI